MAFIDRFLHRFGITRISKEINPYSGLVSGAFWSQTGMPWVSSDGRKAVLTEWFWQPIRGQPRRVDTNELRKFSQTYWVYTCIQTILNEIMALEWDVVPRDEYDYKQVENHIREVKLWLEQPNENKESMEALLRAFLKDVLELDAGVLVKVFTKDSYDFEHLEPKSGAPILKPLFCPYCNGMGQFGREEIISTARSIRQSVNAQLQNPDAESYYRNYQEQLEKSVMIEQEFSKVFRENTLGVCPYCNGTGRGRTLKEIYARDGSSFLKEVDKFGYCKGYWQYSYQIPAHPMWFNREEIVYKMLHPRSMSTYGFSPVQALLDIIKSLHYSVQWNRTFYEETAIPDAMISLKDVSSADIEKFKEYWQREIVGKPHKMPIVNSEIDIKPLSISQKELEFLESQQWYSKLVISGFQLTPAEMGFTEDVNRATGVTQAEVVRRKAIRPLIQIIQETMNEIIKEFGFFDVEFKYTVKDIQEESLKADIESKQLQSGMRTINELRVDEGLQPVQWGDMPMMLQRFAMMGMNQEQNENAKPEDKEKPDQKKPNFPGQQMEGPESELTQPQEVLDVEANIRREREMRDELNSTRQVLKPPQAQMIGAKPQIIVDITTAPPGPTGSIKSVKYTCSWCKERFDEKLDKCPKCGGPMREDRIKIFKNVEDSAAGARGFGNMSIPQGGEQHNPKPEHALQDAHPEITGLSNRPPSKSEDDQHSPFRSFAGRCPGCGFEGLVFQGIQQADSFYPLETDWFSCPRCGTWTRVGEPDLLSMDSMQRQGNNKQPFYGEGGNDRIADFSGIVPSHGGVPTATSEGISPEEIASVGQGILPEPASRKITTKKKVDLNPVRPDSYEQYKIEEKCPLCSSPHVEFVGGFAFHCRDCNFEWTDRINTNPTVRAPYNEPQPITEQSRDLNPPQIKINEMQDLTGVQPPMEMTTRKDASIDDMKAWAGFNYVPFLEQILEFIRNYDFHSISDVSDKAREKIKNVLLRAFRSGEQIPAITRKINRVVGDKAKAEAISRTEIIRATNEGKLKEMEDRDMQKVKWLIAPDERTCEICKAKDGKTFTLAKARGSIPAHPNCRCTWIPLI